jgi:AraC-like DNA-binding protein
MAIDGTSFSEVLEAVRFKMAVHRLLTSDAKLRQIGQDLGYRDYANFSRAFRRWAGVSPRHYRAQRIT